MVKRLIVFSLLWWLLTGGSLENWPLGVLIITLSAWLSWRYVPAPAWSLTGLLRFLPFFLWHSMKGGLDVAARTFRRSMPLDPIVVTYPLRLPLEPAGLFFAGTVNLLPGTLCAELEDKQLTVHILDGGSLFHEELAGLERRVAGLFNVSLSSNSGEQHATV